MLWWPWNFYDSSRMWWASGEPELFWLPRSLSGKKFWHANCSKSTTIPLLATSSAELEWFWNHILQIATKLTREDSSKAILEERPDLSNFVMSIFKECGLGMNTNLFSSSFAFWCSVFCSTYLQWHRKITLWCDVHLWQSAGMCWCFPIVWTCFWKFGLLNKPKYKLHI